MDLCTREARKRGKRKSRATDKRAEDRLREQQHKSRIVSDLFLITRLSIGGSRRRAEEKRRRENTEPSEAASPTRRSLLHWGKAKIPKPWVTLVVERKEEVKGKKGPESTRQKENSIEKVYSAAVISKARK